MKKTKLDPQVTERSQRFEDGEGPIYPGEKDKIVHIYFFPTENEDENKIYYRAYLNEKLLRNESIEDFINELIDIDAEYDHLGTSGNEVDLTRTLEPARNSSKKPAYELGSFRAWKNVDVPSEYPRSSIL